MADKCYIHLLPHDRRIEARPGSSMMEALMAQSIFLKSDCGGRGTCGKCRVKIVTANNDPEFAEACKFTISKDINVEIPESSMLSSHIINKSPVSLPVSFKDRFKNVKGEDCYGLATDLGTTTIAVYLCNITKGTVLSSIAVKNPQAIYGDDVMSRIGAIGMEEKNLGYLQGLVVRAIEWGIKELLTSLDLKEEIISQMVLVGNPTMIHILAGVDPKPIGLSPYNPAFYEAKNIQSSDLSFAIKAFSIQTLPQISGFIGGDILSAAIANDMENQPEGTLLIDLGTNGELLLKGKERFFATSCATGPAFEGATLACGVQAIPGAIDKVEINTQNKLPVCSFIQKQSSSKKKNSSNVKPAGICGSGVVSAVAQFCQESIIDPGGRFVANNTISCLQKDDAGMMQYFLVQPENNTINDTPVFISQKDIRSVQLGKAALITGIEFLLKEAQIEKPEKIIIAGAFGSYLNKTDMMTLGMIPVMEPEKIEIAGNSAGTGAIMALCDHDYLEKSRQLAKKISIVELAHSKKFQEVFIQKLGFPV